LAKFKKSGCETIGIEPSDAIQEHNGSIDFAFQGYFDEKVVSQLKALGKKIDLVVFTNVFAHIEDLPSLLGNVKQLLNKDASLVIENHYLGTVVETGQFDTFYHEHPRTYSVKSFFHIAETLGLSIHRLDFPGRYGGNIRVTMKSHTLTGSNRELIVPDENWIPDAFRGLQTDFLKWRDETSTHIRNLALEGNPIYGKSLPGRAVMLINSLELDASLMRAVFEKPDSPKLGHFIPGTNIPVISDKELSLLGPDDALIIWGWHIEREITAYLSNLGVKARLFSPMPSWREVEAV
jgi:hypothetical protein